MLWPMERAADVMRWWDGIIGTAPEDLGSWFAFLKMPPVTPFPQKLHTQTMCGVVWCYTGPLDQTEEVFRPIRQFNPPALDWVGPLPHPALQNMFDPFFPPGLQ